MGRYDRFVCKNCGQPVSGAADYCPACLRAMLGKRPRSDKSPSAGGGAIPGQRGTHRRPAARGRQRIPRGPHLTRIGHRAMRCLVRFQYKPKGPHAAKQTWGYLSYLQYREGRGADHVKLDCAPTERWIDGGLGNERAVIAQNLTELARGNQRAYYHEIVISPDPAVFNQLRGETPDSQLRFVTALHNAMEQWGDARGVDLQWAAVVHHPIRDYGLQTHAHVLVAPSYADETGRLQPLYNTPHDVDQLKTLVSQELGQQLDPTHKCAPPRQLSTQLHRALATPLAVPEYRPRDLSDDPTEISPAAAAAWLKLPVKTVRRLASRQHLTGHKNDRGEWRLDLDSVEEYAAREFGWENPTFSAAPADAAEATRLQSISTAQAAQVLHLSYRQVQELTQTGALETTGAGRGTQVYRDSIEQYATAQGWEHSPFTLQEEIAQGDWLTTRAAAVALQIPARTVRGLIEKDELAATKAGTRLYVQRDSLNTYAQDKLGWETPPFPRTPLEPDREPEHDLPERRPPVIPLN